MTITRVIRYRPLRRSTAVKFLWWYLTAHHGHQPPAFPPGERGGLVVLGADRLAGAD